MRDYQAIKRRSKILIPVANALTGDITSDYALYIIDNVTYRCMSNLLAKLTTAEAPCANHLFGGMREVGC